MSRVHKAVAVIVMALLLSASVRADMDSLNDSSKGALSDLKKTAQDAIAQLQNRLEMDKDEQKRNEKIRSKTQENDSIKDATESLAKSVKELFDGREEARAEFKQAADNASPFKNPDMDPSQVGANAKHSECKANLSELNITDLKKAVEYVHTSMDKYKSLSKEEKKDQAESMIKYFEALKQKMIEDAKKRQGLEDDQDDRQAQIEKLVGSIGKGGNSIGKDFGNDARKKAQEETLQKLNDENLNLQVVFINAYMDAFDKMSKEDEEQKDTKRVGKQTAEFIDGILSKFKKTGLKQARKLYSNCEDFKDDMFGSPDTSEESDGTSNGGLIEQGFWAIYNHHNGNANAQVPGLNANQFWYKAQAEMRRLPECKNASGDVTSALKQLESDKDLVSRAFKGVDLYTAIDRIAQDSAGVVDKMLGAMDKASNACEAAGKKRDKFEAFVNREAKAVAAKGQGSSQGQPRARNASSAQRPGSGQQASSQGLSSRTH